MAKQVLFNKESMETMVRGMDIVADVVGGTVGPKGRNVYIMDANIPQISNDGVFIAINTILKDQNEDAGAYLIRNVSSQQDDDVGDGTTTAAILTQAIVHECLKRPENVMEVRESLKKAGDKVLKLLSKKSIRLDKKDIEKVALIASENKELAKQITEIIGKLGEKAVINVEDSKTYATEYEIANGYEAKVGFMSPYFINDSKTQKSIHEDILVFVSEKRISNLSDIKPLFDKLLVKGIPKCAIVCEDIADDMLGVFVNSKRGKLFDGVVIRATGDTLKDIEGATGAVAVSDSTGVSFEKVELKHLGKVKKLICDKHTSVFIGNGVAAEMRASELDKQSDNEPNMYLARMIRTRAARLRGGIAILRVGAPTDFEREYLKKKAEDAVKATLAAIEEGVVEGGGMALWRITQNIKPKTIGEQILQKALKSPLMRIIENSGKEYADIIINMPQGQGYDAKEDRYVDMFKDGIIDPIKVERCAIENAVSAASTFISTFATITEIKENV